METTAITKVEKEKAEKQIAEFKPSPAFATALVPKGFKEAMEMAVVFSKSSVVPKDLVGRPESCFVAIGFGVELGLPPMQAIQSIMVVNGRPSIWGDAALALALGSGLIAEFDEDPAHVALAQGYGRCRIVTKQGRQVEVRFSVDDAKRAKLWTKQGPWQDYPGRMLQARARSWAIRDSVPQVLKGMQFREEAEDYEIIHPAAPVSMPQRQKAPGSVQEAELAPTPAPTPKTEAIAAPAPSQEAEQGSLKPEPTAEMPNDAQAPGDAPGDTAPALEPTAFISEERRKLLFKLWTDAKIPIEGVKLEMRQRWKLEKTADLTNAMADVLEEWIIKNPR